MPNAIILHGMPDPGMAEYYNPDFPSASNSHWIPWLQKQLLIRDIPTQTPEMPQAWRPDYPVWKKEFERHDITENTILIGHSCGAGFLLRWLTENTVTVGNVVLVAPWLDLEKEVETDFFEFELDPQLPSRTKRLTVIHSHDDPETLTTVEKLQKELAGCHYREFPGYKHFTFNDLQTVEFPELLEEATRFSSNT